MSAVVDCPTCARQVQIPDNLQGDTVRCPTCGNAFAAPPASAEPASAAAARAAPVETETLKPLEIAGRQIIPRMPELRPTLVAEERGNPRPSTAPPPQPTDRPTDERVCPACGERASSRARRCVRCGQSLRDLDDAPWPYLDCEPHRAGLVLGLGIGSVVLAATCFLSFIGLPLGIAAIVMARGDIKKMRAGTMDPDGRSSVQAGSICGIIGTVLNTLLVLYLGAQFVAMAFGIYY
jgi:hypothetical protein